MADNLAAALHYAKDHGIRVMPLQPRDKVPVLKDWVNKASTDPEQIRKWWEPRPGCNIGGVMGDGIVCIDFDVDEDGLYDSRDFLVEWEREHGKLPETATAVTGRGGMHLFYKVDRKVPKSENADLHIDIRGEGAQAVMAPSVHPNGKEYFWDLDPDDVGIADADENVYALIEAVRPAKAEHESFTAPEKAGKGKRDTTIYKMACSMWAKDMPKSSILAALLDYNENHCDPPLSESEVRKKLESATTHPAGYSDEVKEQQEAKRGRPKKFEHNKVGKRLIEERGACLIDGETPAIRTERGNYLLGWDAFDSVMVDMYDDCTEGNRRETKAWIRAKAQTRRQSTATLIAFDNGILDIETMVLREEYTPDDVIPNVIPHDWNPNARSELLDKTLWKMACGDDATFLNLTEFMGMCMMRSVKHLPFFPVLIGEGANGKSTYIGLLKDMLGMENISGLQPKDIASKFLGTHIVGKTANLGDDIASGYLDDKDCSVIKSVATGDLMFTDVKGTKGFHFEPYCTMVFSCNAFPRLADTTPGFMRRLFPVEFNAVFSKDDPDFDPTIGEKLREEETLQYACVAAVEGLRRALYQNSPTPNAMSEAMKGEIAREANTCLQWVHDRGIDAQWITGKTKDEVYDSYVVWCEQNGYARTAMGSGAVVAQIGTIFRLKLTGTQHRETDTGRKTVRVFERK